MKYEHEVEILSQKTSCIDLLQDATMPMWCERDSRTVFQKYRKGKF